MKLSKTQNKVLGEMLYAENHQRSMEPVPPTPIPLQVSGRLGPTIWITLEDGGINMTLATMRSLEKKGLIWTDSSSGNFRKRPGAWLWAEIWFVKLTEAGRALAEETHPHLVNLPPTFWEESRIVRARVLR
jgi:hypothetical protein